MKEVNFKKVILSFFAVIFMFGLVGCGKETVDPKQSSGESQGQIIQEGESQKKNQNQQPIESFDDIQEEYSHVNTNDWKTYTDKNGLFSFKYPKEWRIEFYKEEGKVFFQKKEDVMGTDGVLRKNKWVSQVSFTWYEKLEDIPDVRGNRIEVGSWEEVFEKVPTMKMAGEWKTKDRMLIRGVIWAGHYDSFGIIFEPNKDKNEEGRFGWLNFTETPSQSYLTEEGKGIISTLRFF